MKKFVVTALFAGVAWANVTAAQAEKVKLNMPSTFPGNLIQLG